MLTLQTNIRVPCLTAREITDFLLTCDDARYQAWWPGTHLQFHTVRRVPGDVGNVIFMDEYIGRFRLTEHGIVRSFIPGREIVVQFTHGIPMPARLILRLEDGPDGVAISHVIEAGFRGVGRMFDPILRLIFGRAFREALDAHVREEFPRLRDLLHPVPAKTGASPGGLTVASPRDGRAAPPGPG